MIQSDFHLHTSFSSDSDASMESMIQQAIALGLTTICFTEHHDIDYPDNSEHLDFILDLASYKEKLFLLKEQYASQIKILYGIELGLMSTTYDKVRAFIKNEPFDFMIASSHTVEGIDPYEPEFFAKYPGKAGVEKYFLSIIENIHGFQDFNVYGHLDYVVRYCRDKSFKFIFSDYQDLIDELLKKIIDIGKGIELNSAGLKYGIGYAHPHPDILCRYHELGGEIITIGSDAHKPEHMAYDFNLVPEILSSCGFHYYTIFEKQKPKFIPL